MPEDHALPALSWVPAWAELQERSAEPVGAGFMLDAGTGQDPARREYVAGWPGPGAGDLAGTATHEPDVRLTLLCADAAAARSVGPAGLAVVAERVLLTAPTDSLDAAVELPDNAQVTLAPMATYDAVEVTVFHHPVAKGRIQVRDGVAAVAITELPQGADRQGLERALFAAMAEEAFLHGAGHLHMVVEPDAAPLYEASGWIAAGRLLSFQGTDDDGTAHRGTDGTAGRPNG
ncbi:hypothetical protein [Pseudarthrobacter sp. C4D7]|uniref:hypothetical protein n=1 Tax=Pseudarthrobacter sp. C4D7 TaxID=2735268 RepID=UPI0015859FB2|nr:hypothetical protein [Pseudarthrobacter sp. C4D7]NUT71903.1 hypothetical protein [Pseudarthrobacter sp. C4D7]